MPFKKRNNMYKPITLPSAMLVEEFVHDEEMNQHVRKLVSASPEMPDLRTTDLDLQLKAGVPLKQVSTVMIPAKSVDFADIIDIKPKQESKQESKQEPKQESKQEPKKEG